MSRISKLEKRVSAVERLAEYFERSTSELIHDAHTQIDSDSPKLIHDGSTYINSNNPSKELLEVYIKVFTAMRNGQVEAQDYEEREWHDVYVSSYMRLSTIYRMKK